DGKPEAPPGPSRGQEGAGKGPGQLPKRRARRPRSRGARPPLRRKPAGGRNRRSHQVTAFSHFSLRYHSIASRYPSASDIAGRKSNCVAIFLGEIAHPVAVASRILSKLTIPGLPRQRLESSPMAAAEVRAQRRTL